MTDTALIYKMLAQAQVQSAIRILTAVDDALSRTELELNAEGCIQIRNALEKSVAILEDAAFPFGPNHVAFPTTSTAMVDV